MFLKQECSEDRHARFIAGCFTYLIQCRVILYFKTTEDDSSASNWQFVSSIPIKESSSLLLLCGSALCWHNAAVPHTDFVSQELSLIVLATSLHRIWMPSGIFAPSLPPPSLSFSLSQSVALIWRNIPIFFLPQTLPSSMVKLWLVMYSNASGTKDKFVTQKLQTWFSLNVFYLQF